MSDPIQKPPYGSPCNKCGQCCEDQLCPLGSLVFAKRHGPCPAILRCLDATVICGLVTEPGRWRPMRAAAIGDQVLRDAALVLIGANSGCDALLEGEPVNETFCANLRHRAAKGRQKANIALDTWGLA